MKTPQEEKVSLWALKVLSCDGSGVGSQGKPSTGTRASTEKKKGKGKQATAAAAAQELEALQAR